jgi:protein TonB
MHGRIGSLFLGVAALSFISAPIHAQSNLTAKANAAAPAVSTAVETDRIRDGLVGPVRRVRTEIAKLSNESGRLEEGKHAVLEVAAYDIKGNKIENQYFPVAGANLTGKELYKYDEKGNISEMTLLNQDGSLLSKEIYTYEFDFAGNWNKMTTSVAVIEAGRMSFEPTEVTYRSIMYYLDENMMKMAQPAPSTSPAVANVPNNVPAPAANTTPKQPANKNNNLAQKSSPSLPAANLNADRISSGASLEVKNTEPVSSSSAPAIHIDSEPPPPGPKPILKPVSGGVLNGTAISLPPPTYPEAARRLRLSGVVSIDVVVDETGKVISAIATSGPAALRDVAVQAAMRARFSPTKLSGQPVKVSGTINYKFAIAQ